MNDNTEKLVVVAGATGHQGGSVARNLLENGFKVRGLTRNPDSQASLDLAKLGAHMVKCDLDNPAETRQALEGAWGAFGAFASWPQGPQHEEKQSVDFARQAKAAGITHYVYSSVASADRKTGIPHFENKWRVESAVRSMGFASYTILRPAFFMENFTGPAFWPGLSAGKLSAALKSSTRIQMIAVDDIGAYGLMAFEKPGALDRAEIELAGDELTMPEAADALSRVLDRKVQFERLPIEAVRKASADMALMYEWFDRTGTDIDIRELVKKYSVKPMTFSEWTAKVHWPLTVTA